MVNATKQTKRARQRGAAEARAAARLAAERRKRLRLVLGGSALVAIVAIAGAALVRGGDDGAGPSGAAQVTAGGAPRSAELAAGDRMPSFSAPGLDGDRVSWNDYAGTPTVVSVWAPWCPHCQVELPVLNDVMNGFPNVGFVTVVTAIGQNPGPTPENYMADHGLTFPVAVDDDAGSIARALGVQGFPTLYFVGSDGVVVHASTGEVAADHLREVVAGLR